MTGEATSGPDGEGLDLLVVGAGFAGLYMLHRARGLGLRTEVIEAGDGVGGTWYWNRYPGARCDVESLEYSYGFDADLQQEWEWTERYATQPEILRYLEHVADRFDLRRDIRFGTRVTGAAWDEETRRWTVTLDGHPDGDGEGRAGTPTTRTARFVVMATGCLSSAMTPDIPGADSFAGPTLHTGRWPHEGVDLTGRRVGVIGTGSSAIQAVPIIAEQAAELTVFQRTPNYAVPAHNAPLDPAVVAEVKADYDSFREANRQRSTAFGARIGFNDVSALSVDDEERLAEYERRWAHGGLPFLGAYNDLLLDRKANETAADFVRGKIHEIVDDPDVAARLSPDQVIGCKRLCVDTGYYATFNRPNVSLVDLRDTPIEAVEATGVRTTDGLHELDVLVFATGFDAMTGALDRIDIRGRGGRPLREAWAEGPKTYLGLMVAGFPNLFTITGPGSPSVLTNMITSIEHHVEWISDAIDHLRTTGRTTIEATPEAQEEWVTYVNGVAGITLFPTCSSWYLGANVPGKPRVFMPLPGFSMYADMVADVVADDYRGFALT